MARCERKFSISTLDAYSFGRYLLVFQRGNAAKGALLPIERCTWRSVKERRWGVSNVSYRVVSVCF